METNYRIAYDKGWEDLKKKSPGDVADCMAVTYQKNSAQFIVPYLNENFIVDYSAEKIWKKSDGAEPAIGDAILILHYLTFFQTKATPTGKWVSLKEIPNGGILFYPAFHKEAIVGLIKSFGHQPALLPECAARLGGRPGSFGDASAIVDMFPKIPLCPVIWEGDEEISANATILFDPSIEHFLHIESIICAGSYLAAKLIKLASPQAQRGHGIW